MSDSDPYAAPETVEADPAIVAANEAAVPEEKAPVRAANAPETVEATVPEGSIKTVLEWVGDDITRAQTALDAENAGEGRKTLVAKLNEIIN